MSIALPPVLPDVFFLYTICASIRSRDLNYSEALGMFCPLYVDEVFVS